MFIVFEDRPSDSPVAERVWRSHSKRAGVFHSMAACHWGMVVSKHEGKVALTVRGPETKATMADCPAEGEWVGVQFKLGTFMPLLPAHLLRDRNDVTLPDASGRTFYLNGSAWEYPGFENRDTFIDRLVKQGLIVSDPCVAAALDGRLQGLSPRTEQRHVLRATGMTQGTIRQIERARQATLLLQNGAAIFQVVDELGYSDQAHLTRSLKHFAGQTPAQLGRKEAQLSLLFNTAET
jgi:hypothetical protein